ncbi:MAG: type II secretion system protein [Planctomycetes bacterium]|nr:type II secretion system protein [Planctomycetota bacterium]
MSAPRQRTESGFTLLELVVVMGILSGFLVMLVQLVDTGLQLFAEGESGQRYADATSRAQRCISRELGALRGTASGRDRDTIDDRLLVQWLPIGLPDRPERGATKVQVLRAAVQLPPDRELELLEVMLLARLLEEEGELDEAMAAERLAAMRATEPLRGIGNMMLLPWRQEGADDAFLELRAGWFLPGQKVRIDERRFQDPFDVLVPGTPELPALVVFDNTTPILRDLLHVEFEFWSQRTRTWRQGGGLASGGAGPETIWDSSRGGWLVDEATGGVFALDRGPASFRDPTDDIQPHAIRVLCTVAAPPDQAAEGLLARSLGADDQTLVLVNGDHWPGPAEGGWLKIGGEWMHYDELRGDRLTGLRRGQRLTKAREHAAGVRVHHGKAIEFVIPLAHAKDDWNG